MDQRLVLLSMNYLEDARLSYPIPAWFSVDGKTVVDVGCDWGNSPVFWRMRGASKVIAYEADERRASRLFNEPWLDFRGAWDGEMPDADIFKIDCDGCERALDVAKLDKYQLWFVALHRPTLDMGPAIEKARGVKVREISQEATKSHLGEIMFRGGLSIGRDGSGAPTTN